MKKLLFKVSLAVALLTFIYFAATGGRGGIDSRVLTGL